MAEMKRYVILDGKGIVQNIVLWDGETTWTPPEGCTAEPCQPDVPYFVGLKPGEKPPEPPPDDGPPIEDDPPAVA
jgi:hypothetical protein